MIDGEGNAYYAERQYCCPRDEEKLFWFWDNNQYDFLVELTTKAIGEIHIQYSHMTFFEPLPPPPLIHANSLVSF